jgi:hypothetical protein
MMFKNDVDQAQSLTDFFTGAKRALVLMPVGAEEAAIAAAALNKTTEHLKSVRLTVLNTSSRAVTLGDYTKCEMLRIDPPDINRFFLPTKSLLSRVLKAPFDVAIDLNLDFVLHTAYICKASRANVRIGFARPGADNYYNVQLQFNEPRTPQAVYEKFAASLTMF